MAKETTSRKGSTRKSTASANKGEQQDREAPRQQPGADESAATNASAEDVQAQRAEAGQTDTGNAGPGTGREAPPDENAGRYPASTLDPNPESAPLAPPEDQATQTEPETGYAASTTDQTYAETGGRSIAGENHVRLVDEDGNDLSADALFDESDTTKTYVTTKTRIYEVFTYPNTTREATRLLYAEGRRVPRFQAERVKAAVQAGV